MLDPSFGWRGRMRLYASPGKLFKADFYGETNIVSVTQASFLQRFIKAHNRVGLGASP